MLQECTDEGVDAQPYDAWAFERLSTPKPSSNSELWRAVVAHPSASYCWQRHNVHMHRVRGRVDDYAKPCGTWTCENCATFNAKRVLEHVAAVFDRYESGLWVATVNAPFSASDIRNRLAQRRHTIRRRDRVVCDSLTVHRSIPVAFEQTVGDELHVYATADLSGLDAPSHGGWIDAADALERFATVSFLLPGPVSVPTYTDGWKPPRVPRVEPETQLLAPLVAPHVGHAAFQAVAERAEQLFGVRPVYRADRPSGIPASWWAHALQRAIAHERDGGDA